MVGADASQLSFLFFIYVYLDVEASTNGMIQNLDVNTCKGIEKTSSDYNGTSLRQAMAAFTISP